MHEIIGIFIFFKKIVISVDEKGLFYEKVSREQPNRTVNLMFAQYVIWD